MVNSLRVFSQPGYPSLHLCVYFHSTIIGWKSLWHLQLNRILDKNKKSSQLSILRLWPFKNTDSMQICNILYQITDCIEILVNIDEGLIPTLWSEPRKVSLGSSIWDTCTQVRNCPPSQTRALHHQHTWRHSTLCRGARTWRTNILHSPRTDTHIDNSEGPLADLGKILRLRARNNLEKIKRDGRTCNIFGFIVRPLLPNSHYQW